MQENQVLSLGRNSMLVVSEELVIDDGVVEDRMAGSPNLNRRILARSSAIGATS